MNPKIVGMVIGGVLGGVILFAPGGGWKFILLGLCILAGWVVGKFIAGEGRDIVEYFQRLIPRGGGRGRLR
jgi:hypothetical protein